MLHRLLQFLDLRAPDDGLCNKRLIVTKTTRTDYEYSEIIIEETERRCTKLWGHRGPHLLKVVKEEEEE